MTSATKPEVYVMYYDAARGKSSYGTDNRQYAKKFGEVGRVVSEICMRQTNSQTDTRSVRGPISTVSYVLNNAVTQALEAGGSRSRCSSNFERGEAIGPVSK